jgi:hypothetical protein
VPLLLEQASAGLCIPQPPRHVKAGRGLHGACGRGQGSERRSSIQSALMFSCISCTQCHTTAGCRAWGVSRNRSRQAAEQRRARESKTVMCWYVCKAAHKTANIRSRRRIIFARAYT